MFDKGVAQLVFLSRDFPRNLNGNGRQNWTDNNEYYCKKQIDNNNFTWTALLSTIEMTSKCPKLASGTTPPPQSCEQKTISRLFIVPYFSVLKILEKERYMQYSRPYYLLTPAPALRYIWNQLNQLQKRSATMSVWSRRPWGKREHCSKSGAPNVNFRKISVWKKIWDLEFSEHLL